MNIDKKCSVYNCEKPSSRKGYCGMHYQRLLRYGDLNYKTPESVRIANNRSAQPRLGILKEKSYKKLNGRHEHRVVMEKFIGRKLKSSEIVHHIDGNRHNNKIENLQVMSQKEHIELHRKELLEARCLKTTS